MSRLVVSYATAKNCMELIKNGAVNDAFESLGITSDDFHLICGSDSWIGADRGIVVGVLNTLTHGILDVLSLPRIEVPVEFRAGVIATFVSPSNIAVACRWLETGPTNENISIGGSVEPASAQQLFGLCCALYDMAPSAQAAWRKRTGRAIREVLGDPTPVPLEMEEENA